MESELVSFSKVFSLYPNLLGKIYSVLFYLSVEDLSVENIVYIVHNISHV